MMCGHVWSVNSTVNFKSDASLPSAVPEVKLKSIVIFLFSFPSNNPKVTSTDPSPSFTLCSGWKNPIFTSEIQ